MPVERTQESHSRLLTEPYATVSRVRCLSLHHAVSPRLYLGCDSYRCRFCSFCPLDDRAGRFGTLRSRLPHVPGPLRREICGIPARLRLLLPGPMLEKMGPAWVPPQNNVPQPILRHIRLLKPARCRVEPPMSTPDNLVHPLMHCGDCRFTGSSRTPFLTSFGQSEHLHSLFPHRAQAS